MVFGDFFFFFGLSCSFWGSFDVFCGLRCVLVYFMLVVIVKNCKLWVLENIR